MKSRWTTFVLLAAVVAVWGMVTWRIFAPRRELPAAPARTAVKAAVAEPAAETLRLDYPDPFLKNVRPGPEFRPSSDPQKPARPRRGKMAGMHLGTVASGARQLYIVVLEGVQYELCRGESGGGYTLRAADRDSVYLQRDGVVYGIELCGDAKAEK